MAESTFDADSKFSCQFLGTASALLCGTEDGSIFKLDSNDGRCVLASRQLCPGRITAFLTLKSPEGAVVCSGHFSDLYILHPRSLTLLLCIPISYTHLDWITCACLHMYQDRHGNACEALVTMNQEGALTTFDVSENADELWGTEDQDVKSSSSSAAAATKKEGESQNVGHHHTLDTSAAHRRSTTLPSSFNDPPRTSDKWFTTPSTPSVLTQNRVDPLRDATKLSSASTPVTASSIASSFNPVSKPLSRSQALRNQQQEQQNPTMQQHNRTYVGPTHMRTAHTACKRPLQVIASPFTHSVLLVVASDKWFLYNISDLCLIIAVPCVNPFGWSGGGFLGAETLVVYSKDGEGYVYNFADRPDILSYIHSDLHTIAPSSFESDSKYLLPALSAPRFSCHLVLHAQYNVLIGRKDADNDDGQTVGTAKSLPTPSAPPSSTTASISADAPYLHSSAFVPPTALLTNPFVGDTVFSLCLGSCEKALLLRGDAGGGVACWVLNKDTMNTMAKVSTNQALECVRMELSASYYSKLSAFWPSDCAPFGKQRGLNFPIGTKIHIPSDHQGDLFSHNGFHHSDVHWKVENSGSPAIKSPSSEAMQPRLMPLDSVEPTYAPTNDAVTAFLCGIQKDNNAPCKEWLLLGFHNGDIVAAPVRTILESMAGISDMRLYTDDDQVKPKRAHIRSTQKQSQLHSSHYPLQTISSTLGHSNTASAWTRVGLTSLSGGKTIKTKPPSIKLNNSEPQSRKWTSAATHPSNATISNTINPSGMASASVNLLDSISSVANPDASISASSSLLPSQPVLLQGHTAAVTCLFYPAAHWNAPSDWLVSGSSDCTLKLWSLQDGGKLLHTFRDHCGGVLDIGVVPSNVLPHIRYPIFSIARDHSVCLSSLNPPFILNCLTDHRLPVLKLRWRAQAGLAVVCCAQDVVYVWQLNGGVRERVASGQEAADIALSCDRVDDVKVERKAKVNDNRRGGSVTGVTNINESSKAVGSGEDLGPVSVLPLAVGMQVHPVLIFDIPKLCNLLSHNRVSREDHSSALLGAQALLTHLLCFGAREDERGEKKEREDVPFTRSSGMANFSCKSLAPSACAALASNTLAQNHDHLLQSNHHTEDKISALAAAVGLLQPSMQQQGHVALGTLHSDCISMFLPGVHTHMGWKRRGTLVVTASLATAALSSAISRRQSDGDVFDAPGDLSRASSLNHLFPRSSFSPCASPLPVSPTHTGAPSEISDGLPPQSNRTTIYSCYPSATSTGNLSTAPSSTSVPTSPTLRIDPEPWHMLLSYFTAQAPLRLLHPLLRNWSNLQTDIRTQARANLTAILTSLESVEARGLCERCIARLPRVPYIPDDGVRLSCAVMVLLLLSKDNSPVQPEQIEALVQSLSGLLQGKNVTATPRTIALELLSTLLTSPTSNLPHLRALHILSLILKVASAEQNSDSKVGGAAARSLTKIATMRADLLLRALSQDSNTTASASPMLFKAFVRAVQYQSSTILDQIVPVVEFVVSCVVSQPGNEKMPSLASTTLCSIAQCCGTVAVHNTNQRVVVGAKDGNIFVYDIKTAARLHAFTAHSHAVTAVAFSSDGRQLASYCSIDQNLRVWQLAGNALMGFLGSGPRCIRVVDGQDKDTKGTHVIGNNMRLVWRPSGEIFLHADGHDLLRLF